MHAPPAAQLAPAAPPIAKVPARCVCGANTNPARRHQWAEHSCARRAHTAQGLRYAIDSLTSLLHLRSAPVSSPTSTRLWCTDAALPSRYPGRRAPPSGTRTWSCSGKRLTIFRTSCACLRFANWPRTVIHHNVGRIFGFVFVQNPTQPRDRGEIWLGMSFGPAALLLWLTARQ